MEGSRTSKYFQFESKLILVETIFFGDFTPERLSYLFYFYFM